MEKLRTIIVIDQGTTSSRAILFTENGDILAQRSAELEQHFPADGWVEHNPEEIWKSTLDVTTAVMNDARALGTTPIAMGITNQRETAIIWDRSSGQPIHNAIVWQDRRTSEKCLSLKNAGLERMVTQRTGLLIDPYFTATKFAWILDNVPGARKRAESGGLCFGTVDTFLIWRLTGGKKHVTDATNASRTSLFDIHTNQWDDELLALFDVPKSGLPEVLDSAAEFGNCQQELFNNKIPIRGVAGDQQASAIGQGCFSKGDTKSTYGTGAFLLVNTGEQAHLSKNKLLTTINYRLNGETTYALEGSIFVAGAIVQWLRDGLQIIDTASETEAIASKQIGNNGVYLVPALTGLGAPHWAPNARGAIYGITRDTSSADFTRAALEAVAYQTNDLLQAISKEGISINTVRVDGGMAANDWLMQFLADIVGHKIQRPKIYETTALGVAMLALMQSDDAFSLADIADRWKTESTFNPAIGETQRAELLAGWELAVKRTI